MAKDTFYFSHDYNSRTDEKIKLLIRKYGMRGYGIFWAIVEDLYNNANALRLDCEGIAFELREDCETIKSIIHDFNLFKIDGDIFGSLSVENRLNQRNIKSKTARESAFKRWSKCDGNANAMQTQSEGNAIKESKGKEIKEIDIDSRKLKFASTLEPYLNKFGRELLNDFYAYWTEPNKSNTKFKQELEKTWDLNRRLETWAKNDKYFKPAKPEPKPHKEFF